MHIFSRFYLSIKSILFITLLTFYVSSCENKSLTDSEEFRPREIHSDIEFHFDRIEVDGIDYLILEKDNNNPHEGFGFMAFRANVMMEKVDTMLAYEKTILHMQALIYASVNKMSIEKAADLSDSLFNIYLSGEMTELEQLERSELRSIMVDRDTLFLEELDKQAKKPVKN